VGKTSLAQTAALAHQSSDAEPIIVGCHRASTFLEVIDTVSSKIVGADPTTRRSTTKKKKIGGFGVEVGSETTFDAVSIPKATNFSEAIELLRRIAQRHSAKPLIVIDEFDLLPDPEKELFADFIKQVGDQHINIQFILCGIGESLDELLLAHASCYRYIEGISVPRLRFDARLEIIENSLKALNVRLLEEHRFRIAAISDGFPHYVHLICEKLYWELFDDPTPVVTGTREHYLAAIRAATNGIQQQLRKSYDKATMKDTDENHFILWAAADHPNLIRHRVGIYASYRRVMEALHEEPLPETDFNRQLANLKSPSCGRILKGPKSRRGFYQFSENIVRGYVRLRAEDEGIELATEYSERSDTTITARPKHLYKPMPGWRRMYSRQR